MTQRNVQNARYQDETKPKGVTKKSASSFKPKSQAASSVVMAKKPKTKEEKKAASKERSRLERKEAQRRERENYTPKTERYTKLRRFWWVALGAAIVLLGVSWLGRGFLPDIACTVAIVLSYAAIIAALYIDLGLIRRERKRWQEEQEKKKSKSARRREKEARIAAIRAEEEENKEKGPLSGLFGSSKKKAVEAADTVVEKQQAAKAEKTK